MMAKQHSVPVVVCCETYKFSEGVRLDSFTKNELGNDIIHFSGVVGLTTCLAPPGDPFRSLPSSRSKATQNQPNLEILDPLYDLTPPSSITAVVTEAGVIPPDSISSIPLALGRLI